MLVPGVVRGKATSAGGLFFVLTSAIALAATAEGATPIPQAQRAAGFVYAPGESGEVGCLPSAAIPEALRTVVTRALDATNLDPDFAVVLTTRVLTCASIFYLPTKNDVTGIGYAHLYESETFDDAPEHRLQGIAFLNDLPYWLENAAEFETAFLHELGHRWLARVQARVEGEDVVLTGRDGDHWSYFLDTSGSPLEGNAWRDEGDVGDEAAIADSPSFPDRYSPLDLYLMGASTADEVGALRLLRPAETTALDCAGRPVSSLSPPQTCAPLELAGSWLPLSIDDIVRAEGPRVPSAENAPKSFSIAFLLLDSGNAGFDPPACEEVGAWADRLVTVFGAATDGRLSLNNVALGGTSCSALAFAEPAPGGCQVARGSARRREWSPLLLWLVAGLGLARRRRRSVTSPGPG